MPGYMNKKLITHPKGGRCYWCGSYISAWHKAWLFTGLFCGIHSHIAWICTDCETGELTRDPDVNYWRTEWKTMWETYDKDGNLLHKKRSPDGVKD